MRKIVSTSDFSKCTENILKDYILQDAEVNFDPSQYGARKRARTEHMLVSFVDRVLKLLDSTRARSAVLAAAADWETAFDRIDPLSLSTRLIKIGIRPSIIPTLISYIENRKMIVNYKSAQSLERGLIGGSPQGTILSGHFYNIASSDCAEEVVTSEDRCRYFDDLYVLELIILTELLQQYDTTNHIPSDIPTGMAFLPPDRYNMQSYLDEISKWTKENKMAINESKSKYIIFSRSKSEFSTRLKVNQENLERVSVIKVLGIWLQEDMGWERNTKEICKKAYSRIPLITKLKYVGVSTEDLLTIYVLFIRSIIEYCSVVYHSSLTQKLSNKIEGIQATCLRVILDVNYVSYAAALEMCALDKLSARRTQRQLSFSLRCLNDNFTKQFFPENEDQRKEKFKVNFARTESYLRSTIPQSQRILNAHFNGKNKN